MRDYFTDKALESDEREDRLPVWVKEKLSMLRRSTTEAVAELDALRSGTKPGPFWLESWDSRSRFYLPIEGGRLMFSDDGSEPLQISYSPPGEHEKGWLNISSGSRGIIAAPRSSNVLMVKKRDDR